MSSYWLTRSDGFTDVKLELGTFGTNVPHYVYEVEEDGLDNAGSELSAAVKSII